MDLSIVIPLLDEAESLPELSAWIERVMLENKFSYEIIFVDDGSSDNSWDVIEDFVHGMKISRHSFSRNTENRRPHEAFKAAKGEWCTMDADLQTA